jgi:hypothetical protein
MPSTINASNTTGGVITTGDGSGILQLQGAGTTGISINTSGAIGVGASPSYGTSGQVLTSAGSGAVATWSTPTGISTGKAIAMAIVFGG